MSRKIRLTGFGLIIIILIAGLISICAVAGQNIGPVKTLKVSSTSADSVKLDWKRIGSADGYFVYQNSGKKYKRVATVKDPKKCDYKVKNLGDSKEYSFYVSAFKNKKKGIVESEKHNEVVAFTYPKQQTVTVDTVQEGALKVNWTENAKCNGYEIEYADLKDSANTSVIDIKDAKSVETDIMELIIGDEYSVRVRSYVFYNGEKLVGKWSEAVTSKVLDTAALTALDLTKPMIAFTFDDGPGYNGASDKILDVIEKYHIKATFFMLGKNAANNTKNVQRKVALGCQIGNHTYDHEHYGKNVTANDIIKASDSIEKACGVRPTAFRSPGGNTTELIRSTCKGQNMPLYYWSLDTVDWKSRDADKIYKTVMKNVSDGDIILMHEIYMPTAEAFERLVPELKKKGYQFVTCDEIVKAKSGKDPEAGTQYVNGKTINNKTS